MIKFFVFAAASMAAFAQASVDTCTVNVDGLQIIYKANIQIQGSKTLVTNGSGEILAHGEVLPLVDHTKNRLQDIILGYNEGQIVIHVQDHAMGLNSKILSHVSVKGLLGPDITSDGTMSCDF